MAQTAIEWTHWCLPDGRMLDGCEWNGMLPEVPLAGSGEITV
jgi:hypothetical protein